MREGKELSCLVCSPAANYCLLSLMWLKWRWRRNRPSKNTPHTHADINPRVHLCPLLVAPRPGVCGGQAVITPSYILAMRNDGLRDRKLCRCK